MKKKLCTYEGLKSEGAPPFFPEERSSFDLGGLEPGSLAGRFGLLRVAGTTSSVKCKYSLKN